jgi:hypothetical protein
MKRHDTRWLTVAFVALSCTTTVVPAEQANRLMPSQGAKAYVGS